MPVLDTRNARFKAAAVSARSIILLLPVIGHCWQLLS
jgi:hypothetical protein